DEYHGDESGGRQAITVGEDGVLRAWRFGRGSTAGSPSCSSLGVGEEPSGLDGVLLWQLMVGDARQVVVALIAYPGRGQADMETDDERLPSGRGQFLTLVARADKRSLELLDADTGVAAVTVCDVWPRILGSLPQAAAYDTSGQLAIFSSITDTGDGALSRVHLGLLLASAGKHRGSRVFGSDQAAEGSQDPFVVFGSDGQSGWQLAEQAEWARARVSSTTFSSSSVPSPPGVQNGSPPPSPRVEQVFGPLAGQGRVLRHVLAVPAAGVMVAIVNEGETSRDALEVWESDAALGNEGPRRSTAPCFRTRLPSFQLNPRLVAAGGRRLCLLDPVAFMNQGELRILEWRPRPASTGDEWATADYTASRSGSFRMRAGSWYSAASSFVSNYASSGDLEQSSAERGPAVQSSPGGVTEAAVGVNNNSNNTNDDTRKCQCSEGASKLMQQLRAPCR
ncbi:unnamed protein product, partial [Polarella glacialis]